MPPSHIVDSVSQLSYDRARYRDSADLIPQHETEEERVGTREAFQEAERQYHWYTGEWRDGRLDLPGYRAALNRLRVNDDEGRHWMLQEGSGQWHMWTGEHWQPGTPYPQAAPSAPPPPPPAQPMHSGGRAPAAVAGATGARAESGGGGFFGGMLRYALGIMVVFGLIGCGLLVFVEDFGVEGLLGVGLAALISMALMARTLGKSWEGEIVELFQKRERVANHFEDAPDDYRDVLYARIRQPSGKMRQEPAMPGWQVGTYLRKRRGQTGIEVVR